MQNTRRVFNLGNPSRDTGVTHTNTRLCRRVFVIPFNPYSNNAHYQFNNAPVRRLTIRLTERLIIK